MEQRLESRPPLCRERLPEACEERLAGEAAGVTEKQLRLQPGVLDVGGAEARLGVA